MEKKIYRLKSDCQKYKAPVNGSARSFYDFQMYVNKSRVQKVLNARKKFIKKYKRPNPWLQILTLLIVYYALVGFIILLSKLAPW